MVLLDLPNVIGLNGSNNDSEMSQAAVVVMLFQRSFTVVQLLLSRVFGPPLHHVM